jgi:ABC-type dipeptide/oligopeptide/nickel transport system permease subunit
MRVTEIVVIALVVFAAILLQQRYVTRFLKRASVPDPADVPLGDLWKRIREHSGKDNPGARVVGGLEVLLSFSTFYALLRFDAADAYLVIAAYLAFKVACKWEVWAHVVKVPEKLEILNAESEIEYLLFRARWGSEVFNRIIAGTLANLMIGFATALCAYFLRQQIVAISILGFRSWLRNVV